MATKKMAKSRRRKKPAQPKFDYGIFDQIQAARERLRPFVEVKRQPGEPRRNLRAMLNWLSGQGEIRRGKLFVRSHFTAMAIKHAGIIEPDTNGAIINRSESKKAPPDAGGPGS